MSITRWDPFREMLSLREAMQGLLEDSFVYPRGGQMSQLAASGNLALDMRESENEYVIAAALPGIPPEDVDISVLGNTVRIHGEFRQESQSQGQDDAAHGQELASSDDQRGQTSQASRTAMQPAGAQGGAMQVGRNRWLLRERRYGAFERVVTLPTQVQADAAHAQFEHGVLTLTLPKAEAAKPRSIRITARPAIAERTTTPEAAGSDATDAR